VLRSDEIRKQLGGVSPLSRLGPDAYTPEMSRSVYAALSSRAATLLGQGHAVIADAVFARPDDRAAIEATALAADVPFVGLWLEAPADTLVSRTGTRGPDVSDADAQVVRRQLAQDVGPLTWHRLDASPAPDVVTARALSMVQDATGASGLAG
jgi:hypothetical protein